MARYAVEFRRSAKKDLGRLHPVVQRRVLRAAESLVYTVDDTELIVAIERVRHRGEVYR
jgi:mRNA-degrading endonuclease RelE of RelBE toxin-antitoxin system